MRVLGPFDLFVQSETQQLYSLDPSFDPADPWAQRSMTRVAESMPEDLKTIESTTFLKAIYTGDLGRFRSILR